MPGKPPVSCNRWRVKELRKPSRSRHASAKRSQHKTIPCQAEFPGMAHLSDEWSGRSAPAGARRAHRAGGFAARTVEGLRLSRPPRARTVEGAGRVGAGMACPARTVAGVLAPLQPCHAATMAGFVAGCPLDVLAARCRPPRNIIISQCPLPRLLFGCIVKVRVQRLKCISRVKVQSVECISRVRVQRPNFNRM